MCIQIDWKTQSLLIKNMFRSFYGFLNNVIKFFVLHNAIFNFIAGLSFMETICW